MGSRGPFEAVEYHSGFAVRHRKTGEEKWISDGVDLLFTPSGKAMSPGAKGFLKALTRSLNESPSETLEAYFPEMKEDEE